MALGIVREIHSDYCKDVNVSREQAEEFLDFVLGMINFSSTLGREAEEDKNRVLELVRDFVPFRSDDSLYSDGFNACSKKVLDAIDRIENQGR